MASLNKVLLIGHLGRDPETRHTQAGKPICNMTVATSDAWKDKATGERQERTEWHRVVIFNENLARVAQEYLKKGSQVYLEGALQTRKWTDKDGAEKYSTEVVLQAFGGALVLLGSPGGARGDGRQQASQGDGGSSYRAASRGEGAPDLDDEIPF